MDNLDVICIGAAIVDIPLQPVSKNIFDVDSYPLERIAMTTGGDAINEATIISRLGHRTALMSRIGKDAAGQFILDHCRKENIDIQSLKQDVSIDTSIKEGANKQVISSQADSLIKISRIWADFFPANTSNQPI
ncbi:PfkB family carbohydrate kinase, partial [Escherichia coli]|uniref:PfkB family carbohydrate kinase n=1 Tax=Escherichia coli TaxID=562 RepID=UPI0021BF0683